MTGFVQQFDPSNPMVKVAVATLILVVGHLAVKLYGKAAERILIEGRELPKKQVEDKKKRIDYTEYGLEALIVAGTLFYLNSSISEKLFSTTVSGLPDLFSILLVAFLGIIGVNLITQAVSSLFTTFSLSKYVESSGLSRQIARIGEAGFKALLYLLLLQFILSTAGIAQSTVQELLRAAMWGLAIMVAGLGILGFKDLVRNFAAGIYLKDSNSVRPGEQVRVKGETGEISDVSTFSTQIDTNDGYMMTLRNSELMNADVKLKKTQRDLETLEDITSYFVAQNEAYCGPASMEMALDIFGYSFDQERIGEKADVSLENGAPKENLMDAVEELTNNEIKTAWVEYDKITDLPEELKAWFNDGALVVPDFYKPEIFPDATTGHYVLSVGVEDDDILVMDPSGKSGGVYYVDGDKLEAAMGEFDHKRGYIVLAPEGTTAHWRIKNDLIYSDKNAYDELSKTLESRLRKIMRQGRILKDSAPESLENYLDRWGRKEKLTRIWSPNNDETGKDS